ncbi:ABC transporter permease [Photobacterium damselae]|uniref:ABC transporter permease n=1 Tax=Photobacterium damselae TaxID=38293 RepID=UPI001248C780|nr:ABC transporter permease [Photobacterium damselae]KAB1182872.1 ABC transporter permease [Photobacterium damselae subsp. damselae]MBF7101638.1 ABC transporter permease [Photobacterium damselae]USR76629.1 ABC transporter permease [Photobacterium damselae]
MRSFPISPLSLLKELKQNKDLILSLTRREISSKYKGSILGGVWAIFIPVFMLAVYTFVFSIVFKAKWNGLETESKSTFALLLFAGLIVFNFFSDCFNSAPRLILNNSNYVKKVVFPLDILPITISLSALFNLVLSVLVWISFYSIEVGLPHLTVLLLPLAILPLYFMSLGFCWLFSALGVYIRDIGQVVGIATTVLMFLSPIFFPIQALPVEFREYLDYNPLAQSISMMRDILFWGKVPDISNYMIYLFQCFIFCIFGYIFFQKTRKGFADVL